jgi:hypothetical protein
MEVPVIRRPSDEAQPPAIVEQLTRVTAEYKVCDLPEGYRVESEQDMAMRRRPAATANHSFGRTAVLFHCSIGRNLTQLGYRNAELDKSAIHEFDFRGL